MEHEIPLYTLIPFILMLGAIAVLPLTAHHFWESNKNKLIVALVLGIPTAIWLVAAGLLPELEHTIIYDYIPFIILLGSLFVITGGIFVDGDIIAKPSMNTLLLGIGAVLASIMGTTGAAMLLIRPVIKTNTERKFKVHTILFFIAIVANCGGLLTPLGDPPLFMMYLRGASFTWFMKLVPEWAFVNIMLLIMYFIADNYYYKKETPESKQLDKIEYKPISIHGKLNFVWLAGVVLAVAFINSNTYKPLVYGDSYNQVKIEAEKEISIAIDKPQETHNLEVYPVNSARAKLEEMDKKADRYCSFLRDIVMLLMALLSLRLTAQKTRTENQFTWEPINEVAFLFLGIFITMVPCLLYLETHAKTMGISDIAHFYYATGGLSSFLDNTPTAVTFHSLALGLVEPGATGLVARISEEILKSICVAAVFFGAMTYIGNGPNFMVKAIAESQNIKMPDFFSYMFKFSIIILLPLFIIAELLFL